MINIENDPRTIKNSDETIPIPMRKRDVSRRCKMGSGILYFLSVLDSDISSRAGGVTINPENERPAGAKRAPDERLSRQRYPARSTFFCVPSGEIMVREFSASAFAAATRASARALRM